MQQYMTVEVAAVDETKDEVLFRKVNPTHTGFLVWRLQEKREAAAYVPGGGNGSESEGGGGCREWCTLQETECYVVYAANVDGGYVGPGAVSREVRCGTVERHAHLWIGRAANSAIAYRGAALLAALDTALGRHAVTLHREAQGHESPRFLSYWRAGFLVACERPVTALGEEASERLFLVAAGPVMTELCDVRWSPHFASHRTLLLDTPLAVYCWLGRVAPPADKRAALLAAERLALIISSPRRQLTVLEDGYERATPPDELAGWERHLPLGQRSVAAGASGSSDEQPPPVRSGTALVTLYRCDEAGGKYRVTETRSAPLDAERDLLHDHVHMVDVRGARCRPGGCAVWVWVGAGAGARQRAEALRNARGFVKKKRYAHHVHVGRALDGHEPPEFTSLFAAWRPRACSAQHVTRVATRYDAATMRERPEVAARVQLLDDGGGRVLKYVVGGGAAMAALVLPAERHGVFFSRHSYVLHYEYGEGSNVAYYWLGADSAADVRLAAAQLALDTEARHVVRVVQGGEPPHLLQLLGGKMRTFAGCSTEVDASGRHGRTPRDYLLQVAAGGGGTWDTRAWQVETSARSLHARHCFVLRRHARYWVWCGAQSGGDAREAAKAFAGADPQLVLQGSEGADWWAAVGGHGEPSGCHVAPHATPSTGRARMFEVRQTGGDWTFTEVMQWRQENAAADGCVLLDTGAQLYVWRGPLCIAPPPLNLLEGVAAEYLRSDPRGRDLATCVQLVIGSSQPPPPTFVGLFAGPLGPGWDERLEQPSYAASRERLIAGRDVPATAPLLAAELDFDSHAKYPPHVVTGPTHQLPPQVDPLRRELHLTFDDFLSLTGITYQQFTAMPLWKQKELKKKVGLF